MFEELWQEITKRPGVVTVQDHDELEHVFNLIGGCESYLEVGTAEGNSLFVLARALKACSPITYIDYGERHTIGPRDEVLNKLVEEGHQITAVHGDSNDYATYNHVCNKRFDVVFIDAGHDDFNVAIDALFYAALATKYIIFHDVQLPDVSRVFDWYCKQFPHRKFYRVVNSVNFGYGIIYV